MTKKEKQDIVGLLEQVTDSIKVYWGSTYISIHNTNTISDLPYQNRPFHEEMTAMERQIQKLKPSNHK